MSKKKTIHKYPFSNFNILLTAIFLTVFFSPLLSNAQCGCDYNVPANQFEVDGNKLGFQPGDVICLPSGSVGNKHFKNINGTKDNPIIIKNCGGQSRLVLASSKSFGIKISYSSHFRITGSGDPGTEYGILIDGPSLGITIQDRSTDFEMDHFRINNTGYAGIFGKTDPSCNPATWRENFTMYNVSFHHNYVTNTGGESFYIGNSHYHKPITKTCNGKSTSILEHSVVNAKVYSNRVENAGRDGIQVGAVISGGEIYDNYVYNYGIGDPNHINGIQLNPGFSGVVYNNYVEKGAGYGLFSLGDGVSLYNNIAYNCTNGGIFCDDRNTTPGSSFKFFNNTLVQNGRYGIYMLSDDSDNNEFFNNIIVSDGSTGFRYVRLNSGSIEWTEGNNVKTKNINDLKFANVGSKDFRIGAGSTAIDGGKDLSGQGVTHDFDYLARPQGTAYDIGAFELSVGNPEAEAGDDKTIKLPINTTILNGSGTSDNSTIVSYAWTKITGGTATLVDADTENLTLNDLEEGVYQLQLEVTDANGLKGTDVVKVTVLAAVANLAPTVDAGDDQSITLPTNAANFTAVASDSDGTIASYLWEKVSGPDITLAGETTAVLSVSNAVQGTYIFKITVKDNLDAVGVDNVELIVLPEAINQAPNVDVGDDQQIFTPTNTINLTGTASDADGTIASLLWEKKSGPAATLVNETTTSLTVNDMVEGQYVFSLTATDDDGAVGSDELTVDVINSNKAPTADAGSDVTITLPTNATNITGSGSDSDGTIAAYLWKKVSGPTATIVNADKATGTFQDLLEGTYVFSLTVTDDDGAIDTDEVKVIVNPVPVNEPPVVSAGDDQILRLPDNSINLTGTASDDGAIAAILWEKKSGPAATIAQEFTLTPSITGLVEGTYVFTLTVTDNLGVFTQDEMTINVLPEGSNAAPIANGGGNKFLTLPTNSITLNGTAIDPDGNIEGFLWEKLSGPAADLSGATTTTLNLSNLVEGQYLFRFTVEDNEGATGSDLVALTVSTVNQAPIVNGGDNLVLFLPDNSAQLNGQAQDPDGSIQSVLWEKISGGNAVLFGVDEMTLNISDLVAGTYEFRITVTDNDGASNSDVVSVTVNPDTGNVLPTVSAGDNQIIYLPTNSTTFKAIASDADGTIATYVWNKVSGPSTTLINENTSEVLATNLLEGVYVFKITVTDNEGGQNMDEVTLNVLPASSNQSPVANAGSNINIVLPTNSAVLKGSGSDSDGTISAYLWTKSSGPAVTLSNANTADLTISNLLEGIYLFQLTVTDNDGATHSDEVKVTVIPAEINKSPIANAGKNQTIVLPSNSTNLVGVGSDEDGTIVSYLWTKVQGPASFNLINETNPVVTASDLVKGTYVFRLTVEDDLGATSFDEIEVAVVEESANQPPIAIAGGDQLIKLPINTIKLFGQGIDSDGSVVGFQWSLVSGNSVSLVDDTTPNLTVNNFTAGVYQFKLTVTDNEGATNSDFVKVTVLAETTNLPPIANAGGDRQVLLSDITVFVAGAASDADGTIVSMLWEKKLGPNITVANESTTTLKLSNLIEGNYIFRFTVEDDKGATDYDEMSLTISSDVANVAPTVDLGADFEIYLPQTTHTFNPTVSDSDGSIAVYFWEQTSGGPITMANPSEANLDISDLVEGSYQVRLVVVDNDGASSSDDVTFNVLSAAANQPPTVNAGNDIELPFPETSTSITAAANDNDGTIASIAWTKISGGSSSISGATTLTPTISSLVPGTYLFQITVTDDRGATAIDQIQIVVLPEPPNQLPIVFAGSNQNIILPVGTIELEGTATDEDGTIVKTEWKQIEGPAVTMTDKGNGKIAIDGIAEEGVFAFQFSATDDDGETASDDILIFAFNDNENDLIAPIAYAGEDVVIVLPDNSFEIIGEAVDSDGTIENYTWSQTGGLSIEFSALDQVLSANNVPEGAYKFTFTVTDNDEQSHSDEVEIIVTESGGFIKVEKIFTPNGDGSNEYWEIENVESIAGCKLEIFTRTGKKVYETTNYQNDWDGQYNGNPLPKGDYYYIINCSGKTIKNGAFRIVR